MEKNELDNKKIERAISKAYMKAYPTIDYNAFLVKLLKTRAEMEFDEYDDCGSFKMDGGLVPVTVLIDRNMDHKYKQLYHIAPSGNFCIIDKIIKIIKRNFDYNIIKAGHDSLRLLNLYFYYPDRNFIDHESSLYFNEKQNQSAFQFRFENRILIFKIFEDKLIPNYSSCISLLFDNKSSKKILKNNPNLKNELNKLDFSYKFYDENLQINSKCVRTEYELLDLYKNLEIFVNKGLR